MSDIISITANGDYLIVWDPITDKISTTSWMDLSKIAPRLKSRTECIKALLESVQATYHRIFDISDCAESLIVMATGATQVLY